MTRPTRSLKHGTTRKNTQRYYTKTSNKIYVFSFTQEPVKRVLGNYHGHRRRGTKRVRVELSDECIDVPFLASLEQMLNDSSILAQVKNNLPKQSCSSSKLLMGVWQQENQQKNAVVRIQRRFSIKSLHTFMLSKTFLQRL